MVKHVKIPKTLHFLTDPKEVSDPKPGLICSFVCDGDRTKSCDTFVVIKYDKKTRLMQAVFPRIRVVESKLALGQDKSYSWASPKLLKNHLKSLNFRAAFQATRTVDAYQKTFKDCGNEHTYQIITFKVGLSDRWISFPNSSQLNELDTFPSMLEDAIFECSGRIDYPDC